MSMHARYLQAHHSYDAPAPREPSFAGLLKLWGWEKTGIPPEFSVRGKGKSWGEPWGPPWAGPRVDAAMAEQHILEELQDQGLPLPASIEDLYEQSYEEGYYYKYLFRRRYPFLPHSHPDRAAETADFQRARRMLFGSLAASHATFLMRTRQQEGITAAAAARKYAKIGLAEREARRYSSDISRDDFLAAWLGAMTDEVQNWGTAADPRARSPSPDSMDDGGGWGQHHNTWGEGGVNNRIRGMVVGFRWGGA
ncbi:hypothetical protein R3P38DRAFT_3173222 [Favolaschia claudopus]|uniref:Uncharacterized protein n=1 Tax=Favolaschia claudopus TaxID=2862362 RepID=A0AAW0DES2_9AGAR